MSVEHNIRSFDGAVVYLPKKADVEGLANLAVPDPFAESSSQEYPYGTRSVIGERVFYYGKVSPDGISTCGRLVQNMNIYNDDGLQDCWEGGSTAVALAAGDTTIIYEDTNSSHVANWFRRGWLVAFYASQTYCLQILSNTVAGTNTTLTMLDAFPEADSNGALFATIHPSIYSKMGVSVAGLSGSTQAAHVGMCLVATAPTASYFIWIQTWGPCYAVPQATLGNGSYERQIVANHEGSINVYQVSTNVARQQVGHALPLHQDDDQFFMLTIAP